MPIKWSAMRVSEEANMIEEFVKQAARSLEQARTIAREALKLPNLPQYIEWDFNRIIGEIDRAIGGGQYELIGRIRAGIESVRKDLPEGSVEEERDNAKHGATSSLV